MLYERDPVFQKFSKAEGKTGMKAGEGFRKWTPEEIKIISDSYSRRLKAAFDVLNIE